MIPTSSVIDVNPEIDKYEKTFKVLLRANQARAETLRRIISPQVADLIEGVRLSGVGDKQLQAFSKLAMKIEKMIAWAKGHQDTIDKLDRKLRDVANAIVLQGSRDESTLDRHLAESIIETIHPKEEYTEPEARLAEEIEIEKPVAPVRKAKTKAKGKQTEKEEEEEEEE